MAKVIKSFHGVKEHRDFLVGDVYVGEREAELIEKGFLEAEPEVEAEPVAEEVTVEEEVKKPVAKKTTTKTQAK